MLRDWTGRVAIRMRYKYHCATSHLMYHRPPPLLSYPYSPLLLYTHPPPLHPSSTFSTPHLPPLAPLIFHLIPHPSFTPPPHPSFTPTSPSPTHPSPHLTPTSPNPTHPLPPPHTHPSFTPYLPQPYPSFTSPHPYLPQPHPSFTSPLLHSYLPQPYSSFTLGAPPPLVWDHSDVNECLQTLNFQTFCQQEIVEWYMAIRSAKLNLLGLNKPGVDPEEV